jgi:uncharacterized delta-60 repeat protein
MALIVGRIFGVVTACLLVVTGIASGSFGPDGREALRLNHMVPQRAIGYEGGRIILLGQSRSGGTDLARLLASGGRDRMFGERGIVRLGFSAADIAVQSDGRIVVVGSELRPGDREGGSSMVVARLLPGGRPDASFGEAGTQTIEFGEPQEEGRSVAIAADNKIVVGGTSGEAFSRFDVLGAVLARLQPHGAPDPSFGDGGRVRLNGFNGFSVSVDEVTVLSSGRVVGAAKRDDQTLLVFRLRADGSLDRRFGGAGSFAVEPPGVDWRDGVFFQPFDQIGALPGGRIVVAGTRLGADGRSSIVVLRYLPSGRLDPTFGAAGIARPGGHNSLAAFAAQSSGRVVLAGGQNAVTGTFAAICLRPDGHLDRRFGHGGRARVSFGLAGWKNRAGAVLFQGRGRVVFAGISTLLTPSSPFPQRTGLAQLRLPLAVR